ncbi:uncharacterized protein [Parasteatoda tepidariorum]|uniref:uncharacterized protein n=1 Tax=Parasteatoda tepidariorum TaxID=114398 RepID=UPI001C724243|nr:uncharacterized protein LOC107442984 [Parasteatoda tepidariorum]
MLIQMKVKMLLRLTFICLFLFSCLEARYIKRDIGENRPICEGDTPCGWEIYKPYIRIVETFVKSPCDCPSNSQCVRSGDDISIAAFVHRCSPTSLK